MSSSTLQPWGEELGRLPFQDVVTSHWRVQGQVPREVVTSHQGKYRIWGAALEPWNFCSESNIFSGGSRVCRGISFLGCASDAVLSEWVIAHIFFWISFVGGDREKWYWFPTCRELTSLLPPVRNFGDMFAVEVPHERQTWRMEAELATNSAVFFGQGKPREGNRTGRFHFPRVLCVLSVWGSLQPQGWRVFFFLPLIFEYNFSRKAQIDWHRYRIDWPGDSESVFEPSSTGYVSNTENPNLHEHTKWAFILSIDFNDWQRDTKSWGNNTNWMGSYLRQNHAEIC